MVISYDPSMLTNALPDYYKTIFPFKQYTKWLCYNKKPSEYFNRREFAFILDGDVHLRYRSFGEQSDFERELCRVAPHKLDLGAIYNHCPKENKKHSDFKAMERELVFDIDLTDYDNVRKCCSEAKVCAKCWKFVVAAVAVLDRALRDDFGFKARMWVFSGRRGVHCWVGDAKARKLTNAGRSSVAEYLSLISGDKLVLRGPTRPNTKVSRAVHPFIETSYRLLMDSGIMDEMVEEQRWLEGDDFTEIFNKLFDAQLRQKIEEKFKGLSSSLRWTYLKGIFDSEFRRELTENGDNVPAAPPTTDRDFLRWFVLWHVYPRLDVNVSTGLNHLLKSPFCIHPKTGNVAVPLDVSKIAEFDTKNCPRIDLLIKELSEGMKNEDVKENRKVLGYKHTSLAPYVENFEKFVDLAVSS